MTTNLISEVFTSTLGSIGIFTKIIHGNHTNFNSNMQLKNLRKGECKMCRLIALGMRAMTANNIEDVIKKLWAASKLRAYNNINMAGSVIEILAHKACKKRTYMPQEPGNYFPVLSIVNKSENKINV